MLSGFPADALCVQNVSETPEKFSCMSIGLSSDRDQTEDSKHKAILTFNNADVSIVLRTPLNSNIFFTFCNKILYCLYM